MVTKIWLKNGWVNIKPTDMVNTTRALHSFCICNGLPDRLFKSQGGWYILHKNGKLEFVSRTLNTLDYGSLFELLNSIC